MRQRRSFSISFGVACLVVALKNRLTRSADKVIAFDRAMASFPGMSLPEIKSAVDALSPSELAELATYIRERDSAAWDAQIEQDAAAGKLDFLFEEADAARTSGTLRDWPDK